MGGMQELASDSDGWFWAAIYRVTSDRNAD